MFSKLFTGKFRKAIFGNKKTTLSAAVAGLALTYGVAESPEQAAALGAFAVAIGALIWGQFVSKDGDK